MAPPIDKMDRVDVYETLALAAFNDREANEKLKHEIEAEKPDPAFST